MATPDRPQGHSTGNGDDGKPSGAGLPDRSRLEETLVKSSIWKKQALRNIDAKRALSASESAQKDERKGEIERLNHAVAKLKDEKAELKLAHRQDLQRLQDAYDQFEKESDSLLADFSQENERLRIACRKQNERSLLDK